MIKAVRDDVIKLESFVAAAFKYDEELTILLETGGYCFMQQMKKKYGESKAKRIIEDMQSNKLLGTQNYSNCKYVYITQNALKYLANKNNTSEKVNTKRKNIEKNPVEKVIIASAIKYEIEELVPAVNREKYINNLKQKIIELNNYPDLNDPDFYIENKERYILEKEPVMKYSKLLHKINQGKNQEIKEILEKSIQSYKSKIEEYEKKIGQSKKVSGILERQMKSGINLYDISKIIALPKNRELLTVYIIDHNKVKPVSKYLEFIYGFENAINNKFENIELVFISYKKERYEQFKKKVENYLEDNITNRNISIYDIDKCYYLEKIIDRTNFYNPAPEIEIKPKDRQAFEKIKKEMEK
ncbi:MAG TPA: hypothetical protein DCM73_01520 [Clostridiales bacterium]|nr:hypothetical protein [Clostridiales bacterium]